MTAYEAHAARLRREIGSRKLKIIIVQFSSANAIRLPDEYLDSWNVLEEAGIPKQKGAGFSQLSLEAIKNLDCDAMFIVPAGFLGKEWSEEGYRAVRAEPLWNTLSVVKRGDVYQVGSYWLQGSPQSANRILSDIERDVLKLPVDL
jgi:ABC-type Fe3+-hydroxamate transport system substrate-binding protein